MALVDDEEIGFEAGTVVGDAADHVRVDRGDGGVDDLEVEIWIRGAQHRLEHASEGEGRLGVAHGGGAAEDEDTVGVGCFFRGKAKGLGAADELRREVGRGAPAVFAPDGFAGGKRGAAGEVGRVAVVNGAKDQLEAAGEEKENDRGDDRGKEEFSAETGCGRGHGQKSE